MRPYAITMRGNVAQLDLELGLDDAIAIYDISDPAHQEFCDILNRGNQLAFGGEKQMGMPLWVMLDCAIVPGAMLGFMVARADVPDELAEQLELGDYQGWVPISEYSACASLEPGVASGFSLQTQIAGQGIATRTKALALAAMGFRRQVGVTQFDNRAIRVHSKFGRLEILVHRPIVHTHAANSFVYAVDLPSKEKLVAMANGATYRIKAAEPTFWFDPKSEDDHARVREVLLGGGKAWIEYPGWRGDGDDFRLPMTLG